MEPLKDIEQLQKELLTAIDGQIASRRYMLDELVGSLYPSIIQGELERLEALKTQVLKLGVST